MDKDGTRRFLHQHFSKEQDEEEIPTLPLSEADLCIISSVKGMVPNVDEIIEEAKRKVPNKLKVDYVRRYFYDAVKTLEEEAHRVYLTYQREMFSKLIDLWIEQNAKFIDELDVKLSDRRQFVREVLEHFSPIVQRLEFETSQRRKARGGRSLEKILYLLLQRIGIPCEPPHGIGRKKLKRVDLVVPNQAVALRRADHAYFLSAKRTLRERWKQTIPERQPNWRVYLITLDTELTEDKANEAREVGVIAFVPDQLKEKPHLRDRDWIRQLSDLPSELVVTTSF